MMNNTAIERVANTDDNKKIVSSIIYELHEICYRKGIIIPADYRRECIEDLVSFYDKYLETNQQKLVDIDYYKIASWYAVFIAEKMFAFTQERGISNQNWFHVIVLCVWRMLEELQRVEHRKIEKTYMKKIICMVGCEIKQNSNFGIGKNGLYMLMLIARVVEIL